MFDLTLVIKLRTTLIAKFKKTAYLPTSVCLPLKFTPVPRMIVVFLMTHILVSKTLCMHGFVPTTFRSEIASEITLRY